MLFVVVAAAALAQTPVAPEAHADVVPVVDSVAPVADDAAPVAAPIADHAAAVVVAPAVACADDDAGRTRAVLLAFADHGRRQRIVTAVSTGAIAAGLIGTGITYVAVSHVDHQLSTIDAEDTELAGYVMGAVAVIPAAIMLGSTVFPSSEEARLADFDNDVAATDDERSAKAKASLTAEASQASWPALVGGSALVVGGLASGGLGAYFLLLPHLENPRGPMTHGTGAELIGGGVAALGTGVAVLLSSTTAPLQLELLE